MDFKANEGKNLAIEINGEKWLRIPIHTHVVMRDDDIFSDVVDKYTKDIRQAGDIVFCSEKIIAITQGRSYPISEIKPSALAKFLVKFVYKSPHVRGVFYKVCGKKAYAIDGPCDYTLPPYNKYAKKAPLKPNKVAREMKNKLGNEFIVLDANDLNVDILGKSSKNLDDKFLKALFKDNPLGQSSQQTPIAIVRKA